MWKSPRLRRLVLCGAVIATALAAGAESAQAGEAKVANAALVYTAGTGETNVVAVTLSGLAYTVEDTGAPVTPGPGCIQGGDEHHAECNSMGVFSVTVNAGDGDDQVTTPVAVTTWAFGDAGSDVLTGGGGEDILDGGAGDDTLNGGPGDDFRLAGDSGNDQVNGDGGDDELTGGPGNDTLSGGLGSDQLEWFGASGPGNDVLGGGEGDDFVGPGLGGTDDSDSLAGGPGFDIVSYWWRGTGISLAIDGLANDGSPGENDNVAGDFERLTASRFGDDTIVGSDNGEVIDGEAGHDSIDGRGGADTITAAGTIDGGDGADTLTMTGQGTARGGEGNDTLNDGLPGPGYIFLWELKLEGGPGNDILNGGHGNDRLDGGPGADTMIGGDGGDLRDTADYSSRTNPVFVDLDGVADDGESGEGDLVASDVENILGGSAADTLEGNGGDNRIVGGGGSDTMSGGTGTDTLDYSDRSAGVVADLAGSSSSGEPGENDVVADDFERAVGGGGGDVLRGNAAANWIEGGAGDDILDGRLGADQLRGGDGDDTVDYSSRAAAVRVSLLCCGYDNGEEGEGDLVQAENAVGGAGDDVLLGGVEGSALKGGAGADTISGLYGDDILQGGSGNDDLAGAVGDDELNGGDGDDTLDGSFGADLLVGGSGADTVDYSSQSAPVSVTIDGTADDGLSGEEDNVELDVENVVGGTGDDVLVGSDQPNALQGGAGNDFFDGGLGADVLVGGAGIDDVVDYSERTTTVTIDLDGTPTSGGDGDGPGGGGDTVGVDIEDAVGGSGNDTLSGNAVDNILDGGRGADMIRGGAGLDLVDYSSRSAPVTVALDGVANDGESGENDAVDVEDVAGGSGADRLSGDARDNWLLGLAGNDVIEGGAGEDYLSGGVGNDDVRSRDGEADAISCGEGVDELFADDLDDDESCENVHRGLPSVGGPTIRQVTQTTASFSAPVQPRGQATAVYAELGTTTSYGNRSTSVSLPASLETYTVIVNWSGLSPSTAYHFRFVATNADGTTYGPDATLTTVAAPSPAPADLAVSASAAPAAVLLGRSVTYTIAVTNRGPNAAAEVVLSNSPPQGARVRSIVASQGTCPSALRCDLGRLAANAVATVRITLVPRVAGRSSLRAGVVSAAPDSVPGNNSATGTATVRAPRPQRVVLCHKGRTIKVPKSQVKKHRKHGDKFGPCRKKRKRR